MSEENKELIIEEVEIKGKKRKINLEKYAKFFSSQKETKRLVWRIWGRFPRRHQWKNK